MNDVVDARLQDMQERMLGKGFGIVLGAQLEAVEEGYCRIRLPYKGELSRGDGLVHGGVTAALIDKAGTTVAWSYHDLPEGTLGSTVAMNVSYLEGADGCDLIAEARVVRRGGSLVVIDIDVTDPNERLIAKGLVTYKISRPRK